MESSKKEQEELRDLYRSDYVTKFEQNRSEQSRRVAGILTHIPFNKTDLVGDFACGNGIVADYIHDKVQAYYGVDFSDEFIQLIQQKVANNAAVSNVYPFAEDIISFCKEKPAFFDKALTLDFSEHIYDEEFMNIYTAIYASLKKGGSLFLHTPNGEFLIEIFKDRGIMKQFEEHIAVRGPKAYIELLSKIGFKDIQVKFIPHYNVLKHLHLLSFVPIIGKYFKARILIQCTK